MAAGEPVDPITPVSIPSAPDDRLPLNPDSPASADVLNLASPMFNVHPSPQGIGGWLVLVAIGLAVTPLLLIRYLWLDLHELRWPARVLIGLRVPGLPTLIGFEFFANAVLLVALFFLIYFFFTEDRLFPRTYQLWMGSALVARIAELTLSFHLGAESSWEGAAKLVADLHAKLGFGVFRALISAAIWITYFEMSERVKATFVK